MNGIAGIGKSALAREATLYLKARQYSKDGILYFGLKECPSIENFMKRWLTPIKQAKFTNYFTPPKDF